MDRAVFRQGSRFSNLPKRVKNNSIENMPRKIAINGFGRIGRLVLRAVYEQRLWGKHLEVVAVNDVVDADNLAYLLAYDSTQGPFPCRVEAPNANTLLIDKQYSVEVLNLRKHPSQLPWKELGAEIIIESTGLFTQEADAVGHLEAGAGKVLISAPASGQLKTIVLGINDQILKAEDCVVSNASCTTNCLAPMAKVILDRFGMVEGLMTTVHAYTSTQKTVDGPSKKDYRGGRAAAANIIASSTGAAKAVGLVLPQLQGKLTGMSFRVGTPTVSVVDLCLRTEKSTTYPAICQAMKEAAEGELKGILEYTDLPLVSTDFVHNPHSCIFDAKAGIALNDRFFKLVGWYDNEWGYSNRCVELALKLSAFL